MGSPRSVMPYLGSATPDATSRTQTRKDGEWRSFTRCLRLHLGLRWRRSPALEDNRCGIFKVGIGNRDSQRLTNVPNQDPSHDPQR
ncbi:hypothetical protein NL676_031167 [Syzygium grande]|nr:hypothetical protein NL676_031167 [Syzygium grande]